MRIRFAPLLLSLLVLAIASLASQKLAQPNVSYITYEEARPVLEALREVLPAELASSSAQELPALWPNWVASRDRNIRARLDQGNEDSLVNFLLFGTMFTRNPRITLSEIARVGEGRLMSSGNESPTGAAFLKSVYARADDLLGALSSAGQNERLLFARQLLESKGYEVMTEGGRTRAKQYLLTSLARVLGEHASYAKVLESAKLLGDPSAEFAERSKLYSSRGLSSDTSLLPNFAIEQALASLKSQNLLPVGSVRRVGVIGPGLDFTDKQDGYDFYPEQTIQPFAIIDSLIRFGLARANDLRVVTFDLNPRVNSHLRRATESARRGVGYTIQLPRDPEAQWKPEATEYWSHFGDQISSPVAAVRPPANLGNLTLRAVRVRAAIVSLITPEDTNIVLQRPDLAPGDRFDLLIATNILVYYDVFEQSLALLNVGKMLRPGGFLLSNNALLELPASRVHSVGYNTAVYSNKPSDGDHIVWYQLADK